MTEYSCLVHFSKSEVAAPLVVLEALSAGLSIVTTDSASDNLEAKDYISAVKDSERNSEKLSALIAGQIKNNDNYRNQIRKYAYDNFDYSILSKKYIEIAKEFISENK